MNFEDALKQVINHWFKKNLTLKQSDPSKIREYAEMLRELIRAPLMIFDPMSVTRAGLESPKETPRGKTDILRKGANRN